MRWLDVVSLRLRSLLHRASTDHELERELQFHIDRQTEENIAAGMSREEARFAARRSVGAVAQIQEECRDTRRVNMIDNLRQDLRYGLRTLRRTPVFAGVVVLTLALGIGANTAIFSVMNAALLRFLPVRSPERLVYLGTTSSGNQSGDGDTSITEYMFEQVRAQKRIFSDVVAYAPLDFRKVGVRYSQGEPEEAYVDMVSGDFFSGLGVSIVRGRTLTLDDEAQHSLVAVVSNEYWTRRLGRSDAALGQILYIKGAPFTIAGIAAEGFFGIEHAKPTDVWIPLQARPDLKPWGIAPEDVESLYGPAPQWWCLKTMARLAPGVSEKQALAQAGPIFERAAWAGSSGPRSGAEARRMVLLSGRGIEGLRDQLGEPIAVLMTMVGLVLVIACGNIAMLLAARNTTRQREFSLRMALGGNRARLFRQLLTESFLLVSMGAALAWLFTVWVTNALAVWAGFDVSFAPDGTVLLFTAAVSIAIGLIFALAPLRGMARISLALGMKNSAATSNRDRGKIRGGQVVIALQTALCLTLLVGAGLLVRTLRNLETKNLGLRTPGLLVFGITPPQSIRSDTDGVHFYQTLLDRIRNVPRVQGATVLLERIGAGGSWNTGGIRVDGADPNNERQAGMRWNAMGPDSLHILGIPILRGRDFTEADSANSQQVAVVDQAFADRYLPGVDPIGHRIGTGGNLGRKDHTIVGVAANSNYTHVRDKGKPTGYFPYTQVRGISTMNVELRTTGDPMAVLPEVRRAIREVSPDLLPLQPKTQQQVFETESSFQMGRLLARLSAFFGLLAAVLVATGLYGTLAYAVNRRTTEVGVRMALGAKRGQVLWMILRQSLNVTLIGIALGLPLALFASRSLRSMLFGLAPTDPATFAAALGGLILVAAVASFIPARRAASVDPIVALRNE